MNADPDLRHEAVDKSLDDFLKDIHSLDALTTAWEEAQKSTHEALLNAHDDLHREALARLVRCLKQEPAALALLKQALGDEVIYAVLRRHNIIKPALQERLEDALDTVRPFLESHGGNVELVSVTPPDSVEIRLLGACDGCPASALTLREGVEKAIQLHCPEILHIKKARGGLTARPVNGVSVNFVSPFARAADAGWAYACQLNDIPEADIKLTSIDGNAVLLSRFDDRVTCFQNACAHMAMPMDMGEIHAGILTCPHHGFQYALDSGECLTVPEVQLHAHAVRIQGNRVEVKLL